MTLAAYHRLLLLFVDGVGLAPRSSENPFSTVPMPALARLLGGPMTSEQVQRGADHLLIGIDACLDIDGLPQSATGQASLFSGRNGAAILGRHQTGLPGPRMRRLVERHGLLVRARRAGCRVTFANAFTPGYLRDLEAGRRRPSVTTSGALAAGLRLRDLNDLAAGGAVAWDFCRDRFAALSGEGVETIGAETAGGHLAKIASRHDLTVYETFLTDMAGHLKRGVSPQEALERLDEAIAGLDAGRPGDLTWLMTSDHGNLEDLGVGTHTRHPVPLLVVGPLAGSFSRCRTILDVTPTILRLLGASS